MWVGRTSKLQINYLAPRRRTRAQPGICKSPPLQLQLARKRVDDGLCGGALGVTEAQHRFCIDHTDSWVVLMRVDAGGAGHLSEELVSVSDWKLDTECSSTTILVLRHTFPHHFDGSRRLDSLFRCTCLGERRTSLLSMDRMSEELDGGRQEITPRQACVVAGKEIGPHLERLRPDTHRQC